MREELESAAQEMRDLGMEATGATRDALISELDEWLIANQPREGSQEADQFREVLDLRQRLKVLDECDLGGLKEVTTHSRQR